MLKRRDFFRCAILPVLILSLQSSCSFFTMSYEDEPKISVEHLAAEGDIRYTINITDTPVDVFFSFTNIHESEAALLPDADQRSLTVNGVSFPAPTPQVFEVPEVNRHPFRVFLDESSRELISRLETPEVQKNTFPLPGPPSFDVVDGTGSFTAVDGNDNVISENATCRAVVPDIATAQGNRTLNIWVADDCWGGEGGDVVAITTPMIDALVDKFLKTGLDNDIYDWVTTILGPEWGTTGYTNHIPMNNEITILLSDINKGVTQNGVIVGYFWPVHNYTDTASGYPGSNERIMFVIDAVLYADSSNNGSDEDTTWEATDHWPRIVFSTLAHEFQHMIHFYQKYFVADAPGNTETWIDEMCSMLVEDSLADKMGVEGPRGVGPLEPTAGSAGNTLGRLPGFNEYLFRSVLVDYPDFELIDYSVAYALGAYLARNYGGAEFLRRVVSSPYTDKQAIEYAVRTHTGGEETFEHLLERWGAAVFLSDKTAAPLGYRYNSGSWFASAVDGKNYNLGSINLYNYNPAPGFAESLSEFSSGQQAGSNIYLLAAEDATGKLSWDISVPEDVRLTVIFKGK